MSSTAHSRFRVLDPVGVEIRGTAEPHHTWPAQSAPPADQWNDLYCAAFHSRMKKLEERAMRIAFVIAILVFTINALVDLSFRYLDPRLRTAKGT